MTPASRVEQTAHEAHDRHSDRGDNAENTIPLFVRLGRRRRELRVHFGDAWAC